MSSERPSFRESALTSGLVTEEHLRLAATQIAQAPAATIHPYLAKEKGPRVWALGRYLDTEGVP